MKHPRTLRLAGSLGLIASFMFTASASAITPSEMEALNLKAARGNTIAQYTLGLAYADRREPIHDPVQAYVWLSLAASNGANGKPLATLTESLTPAQLAEGKRRLASLTANPVAPASSPITAAPELAASAPAAVPDAGQDQKKLSAELAAAWKETELLKAGLGAQLADANKRIAIAEAALASKDREIASLQNRLSEAVRATPAPAAAETASRDLAALRSERDQLQAAATSSARELAELRAAIAKSTSDQTALREKLDRAVQELAATRRTLNLAESESTTLKAAADRATSERLTLNAQLETATAELAATRDQLAQARSAQPAPATDTESVAKLAELATSQAETDAKLAASLRSFTLQQAEIDRLQKSLASIDEERAATADKLAAATAELNTLRPQASQSAAAATDAENLRIQLADAQRTASEQAAALAAARQGLADARKTVDTATAELVATRDQLRQSQDQAAAAAVEAQQLRTRLALVGNAPSGPSPARPGTPPAVSLNLPPAAPATPAPPPAPAPRFHTVAPGDSLSKISKQYYGTVTRWNDILQANRDVIRNPDALTLGTQLRIP
jgi:LysM repeat protein/predicted  nucleic acid-binding Zn-ribbon protein